MEWFEDEGLWRELYPYVFPVERVEAAAAQVGQIVELSGVGGGAVLDLCCGPGRHAVEFARRGFAVTGVDRSRFLLDRAWERAEAERASAEWVQADMREFARPGGFHLACNLFTSFGYFDKAEDNLRVLANVFASLHPGGVFVMDMVGRERVQRQGLEPRHTQFADGAVLIQEARASEDWRRLDSEWTVVQADGAARSYRLGHWLYSGEELRGLLLYSGFAEVGVYGDLEGSPYGSDATRLVAVARKG